MLPGLSPDKLSIWPGERLADSQHDSCQDCGPGHAYLTAKRTDVSYAHDTQCATMYSDTAQPVCTSCGVVASPGMHRLCRVSLCRFNPWMITSLLCTFKFMPLTSKVYAGQSCQPGPPLEPGLLHIQSSGNLELYSQPQLHPRSSAHQPGDLCAVS